MRLVCRFNSIHLQHNLVSQTLQNMSFCFCFVKHQIWAKQKLHKICAPALNSHSKFESVIVSRFSENHWIWQYSTSEFFQWCHIDWNSVNFHWISETFTDSNLEGILHGMYSQRTHFFGAEPYSELSTFQFFHEYFVKIMKINFWSYRWSYPRWSVVWWIAAGWDQR